MERLSSIIHQHRFYPITQSFSSEGHQEDASTSTLESDENAPAFQNLPHGNASAAQSQSFCGLYTTKAVAQLVQRHSPLTATSASGYQALLADYAQLATFINIRTLTSDQFEGFYAASELAALAVRTAECRGKKSLQPLAAFIQRKAKILDGIKGMPDVPAETLRKQYTELGDLYSRLGETNLATDAYLDANLYRDENAPIDPKLFDCGVRPASIKTEILGHDLGPEQTKVEAGLVNAVTAILRRLEPSSRIAPAHGEAGIQKIAQSLPPHLVHALNYRFLSEADDLETFRLTYQPDAYFLSKLNVHVNDPKVIEPRQRYAGYLMVKGRLPDRRTPTERAWKYTCWYYPDYHAQLQNHDPDNLAKSEIYLQLAKAFWDDYIASARNQTVSIAEIFGERVQYSEETKKAVQKILDDALDAHLFTPKEVEVALMQLEPTSSIKPASQGEGELVDVYRTINRQDGNMTGVFHAIVYPREIKDNESGFKQVFTSTELDELPRFKDAVRNYIKKQGAEPGLTLALPGAKKKKAKSQTSAQPKNFLPGFKKFKGGVVPYLKELVRAISTGKAILREGATLAEQEQGKATMNYYLGQLKQFLQQKLNQITPEELASLFTDMTAAESLLTRVSLSTYASSVSALSDAVSSLPAEDREKYRNLVMKCHEILVEACCCKKDNLYDVNTIIQAIDKSAAVVLGHEEPNADTQA